jgi:hypothetical protein
VTRWDNFFFLKLAFYSGLALRPDQVQKYRKRFLSQKKTMNNFRYGAIYFSNGFCEIALAWRQNAFFGMHGRQVRSPAQSMFLFLSFFWSLFFLVVFFCCFFWRRFRRFFTVIAMDVQSKK